MWLLHRIRWMPTMGGTSSSRMLRFREGEYLRRSSRCACCTAGEVLGQPPPIQRPVKACRRAAIGPLAAPSTPSGILLALAKILPAGHPIASPPRCLDGVGYFPAEATRRPTAAGSPKLRRRSEPAIARGRDGHNHGWEGRVGKWRRSAWGKIEWEAEKKEGKACRKEGRA
ncbi:unnamed protein product [Urochloa humidicola]